MQFEPQKQHLWGTVNLQNAAESYLLYFLTLLFASIHLAEEIIWIFFSEIQLAKSLACVLIS